MRRRKQGSERPEASPRGLRVNATSRFAIMALAVMSLLAALLLIVFDHAIVAHVRNQVHEEARVSVGPRLIAALAPADFAGPLSEERRAALDTLIAGNALFAYTTNLRLLGDDGRVIYTAAPPAAAATTRAAVEHITIPVQLNEGDEPSGTLEIGQSSEPYASRAQGLRITSVLGLGAGFGILYLALLGIVHWGARTIQRQNRALDVVSHEQARAERERQRLGRILESITDFVAIIGPTGRVQYLNTMGRGLLGLGEQAGTSHLTAADFHPDRIGAEVVQYGYAVAAADGVWSGESVLLDRDGIEVPISQVIVAHRAADGEVEFYSTIARDISERKHFESKLMHLASHDPLTGLYNRRRFEEELERRLAEQLPRGSRIAVLFLDLDGFKAINDGQGHRAGDEFLISVANLLRRGLRDSDVLARLGGDEFAVLLTQTSVEQAEATAQRLLELVRRHAFVVNAEAVRITTSIGIALYPDHGATAQSLLVHADLAMYRAKESGRDSFSIDRPAGRGQVALVTHTWEHRIREALDNDRFVLHAQPIQSLSTCAYQYELLIRLREENGQLIMPGAFLTVAERTGLIRNIDRWVLSQAIHLIAAEQRAGRSLRLEVNLSGKAFADPDLLSRIARDIVDTEINPGNLTLEITETAAIADIDQAGRFINTLRGFGCRFALDDFGVGFSSFSYLKQLPVDYLKIDGSFIKDLPNDPVDQEIVKAVVKVARGLGKETIAEFVEDAETVRLLTEDGVDHAQGYFIGRPRPISELLATPMADAKIA